MFRTNKRSSLLVKSVIYKEKSFIKFFPIFLKIFLRLKVFHSKKIKLIKFVIFFYIVPSSNAQYFKQIYLSILNRSVLE